MFKFKRRMIIGLVELTLLAGLVLLSCDAGIKGKERQNRRPVISFSNIPVDSCVFSATPEVSWYALDIDGYIIKYQYAVVIADSISHLWGDVNGACSALVRISPEAWLDSLKSLDLKGAFISAVDTTTSVVKVQLFAGDTPNDTIAQHLFVRAIDDDSAISNIIHRMFSRNNHKPKAHINYTSFFYYDTLGKATGVQTKYCLPETTETWKGIKITWEGSDSDDYRGTQPDFLYKWELWGPFADTLISPLDTIALKASDRLVDTSSSEEDNSGLVGDKSLVLTGLVNHPHFVSDPPIYPHSDPDLGFGWYLLKVWSMDDAFALSDTAGYLFFRIIHPQFSYQSPKKILVLDFNVYGFGDGAPAFPDSIKAFYERAFGSMANCSFTFVKAAIMPPEYIDTTTLTRDVLSKHNLVVYLKYDAATSLLTQNFGLFRDLVFPPLKEYLKIGGRVWAIGGTPAVFGLWPGLPGLKIFERDFTAAEDLPCVDFATTYFGLLGAYNVNWSTDHRNEEFIGAEPYGNFLDVPVLKTDSIKVKDQVDWGGSYPNTAGELPFASYTYLGRATRIYTFVSAEPVNSQLNDRPCGSVYEHPDGIFKTAHLSFGLHFIDEGVDGAIRDSLFKGIVGWLLED